MEKNLEKLFDYQKFSKNKRIERMAVDAEDRYAHQPSEELSDYELSRINAAGTADCPKKDGGRKNKT